MGKETIQVKPGSAEPAEGGALRTPYVDIYQTDAGLTVVAEMPGVEQDSIGVQVEKGVLTISGRAEPPNLSGYNALYEGVPLGGNFFRAFALSDEVDRDKATATLRDGVLTVVLPRAPQARSRKITVEPGP